MFIGLGSNICNILDILDILDKVDLHHLADCKHVCSQTWQVSSADWNHPLHTLSSVSQFRRNLDFLSKEQHSLYTFFFKALSGLQ